MSYIAGKLKVDITVDGITYKSGEEIAVPIQYGLEDCFEKYIESDIDEIVNEKIVGGNPNDNI